MQIFNVQWKWNIPNALSLLRLVLVPAFSALYLLGQDYWAFGVLALSGLTDLLDGWIARRFHQITDCGKLLDPLADKLTQVMVVICLTTRYRELLPLTIICFFKELFQAVGGMILLHNGCQVRGSKWFGKVSTVVFYLCMLVLVLWHDRLAGTAFWVVAALVSVASLTMLIAFIGYLRLFIQIHRTTREKTAAPAPEAEKD